MNLAFEFSKVKGSFNKVKEDITKITHKINENYDSFVKDHHVLTKEVERLRHEISTHILHFNKKHQSTDNKYSPKEILNIKGEIKELKKEIKEVLGTHHDMHSLISEVKKNKEDVKGLKDKLHSNELEIYLLKERLLEKNVEIQQMKDISKHMLDVVDDLSNVELDILNSTENKI